MRDGLLARDHQHVGVGIALQIDEGVRLGDPYGHTAYLLTLAAGTVQYLYFVELQTYTLWNSKLPLLLTADVASTRLTTLR